MGLAGNLTMWLGMVMIIHTSQGAKILMMPLDHAAHVNFFSVVGETLQQAGHDVHIVVPLQHEKIAKKFPQKILSMNYSHKINFIQEEVGNKGQVNMFHLFPLLINALTNQTRELFADKKTMTSLEKANFDMVLIDGSVFARHFYALPYKLDVPYITLTPIVDPWASRVPSLPSIEGQMPYVFLDKDSTLFDRVKNTLVYITLLLLNTPMSFNVINDNILSELVPERPNIGYTKIFQNSEMVLVNYDIICTDFPRVSSTYYQFIGGLGTQPPKPLPAELDRVVSKSKHGVIVLTFGSGMKTIPDRILGKMLDVFITLKQTIVMRHIEEDKEKLKLLKVPPNVHMMSWLPQNDLLGHPNTKLFITHTGGNGQLETIYHGVPILAMPLFGDQPYNAKRAVLKGYGLQLDPNSFTVEQLKDTIIELLENKTYSDTIKKCSAILHDLPNPQKQVLFWVEHVLKFGSQHLKPFYLDMPLWKFLMFDVQLVFLAVLVLEVLLVRWCICKCCCGQKKVSKKRVKKD